jgi:hypothetical protein
MRHRRTVSGLAVLLGAALAATASPIAAQSPDPSAEPSPVPSVSPSPTPVSVPLCADLPELDLSAAPFRDTPVYVSNEQPTGALRAWARQHPGYQTLWLDRDHLGWVVLAFSEDAEARQAELAAAFPEVGAVAVGIDWTVRELARLQRRAVKQLRDTAVSVGTDITKGVVVLGLGTLTPRKVAAVNERFAGERVCIDGIDPATLPKPGPQRKAGDGWRLLGDQKVGAPYRVAIMADQASLVARWQRVGMKGAPPAVDFQDEVAVWFGAVYGGNCPRLRLDDVLVDATTATIHPLIVNLDDEGACWDDARGHSYWVAIPRDRLPAAPFRIGLRADPDSLANAMIAVATDLREPGSTLGPDAITRVKPSADVRMGRSGDIIEAGFPADYLADARCGLEWLGQVNDIWWRTEAPAGATDWVPEAWRAAVREDGMLPMELLLLAAGGDGVDLDTIDEADLADRPRLEATANGVMVIYRATTDAPPICE